MFRTGRLRHPLSRGFRRRGPDAAGCASQRADGGAGGRQDRNRAPRLEPPRPVVLTGATLPDDGEAPKLLLSAEPVPSRPWSSRGTAVRTLVVDLPGTVLTPGLEPPRADGAILAQVGMRAFSELGHPHLQFELTGRQPLDSQVGTEPGGTAMAVQLTRHHENPVSPAAVVADAAPSAPAASLSPEPEVKSEPLPTPVVARSAASVEPGPTAPASFPEGGIPSWWRSTSRRRGRRPGSRP